MKKKFLIFALMLMAVGMSLTVVSCSSDDDKYLFPNDEQLYINDILGVWEMERSYSDESPNAAPWQVAINNGEAIFEFQNNNVLKVTSLSNEFGDVYLLPEGTYSYKTYRKLESYDMISFQQGEYIDEYHYQFLPTGELMIYKIIGAHEAIYPGLVRSYFFKKTK